MLRELKIQVIVSDQPYACFEPLEDGQWFDGEGRLLCFEDGQLIGALSTLRDVIEEEMG